MLPYIFFISFYVIGVTSSAHPGVAPVLLWGMESPPKPSLKAVQQQEFAQLLEPLLKNNMIVAFQEDNLSPQDFLCLNSITAESCYAQLKTVMPKTYYATVENPTEALISLTLKRENISVGHSGALTTKLACSPGKVVFVNLKSLLNERGAVLEAHDSAISEITKDIDCPSVFLYMRTSSATIQKQRTRRSTAASGNGNMFRDGSNFLLYFTKIFIINGASKEELVIDAMNVAAANATSFEVSLTAATGKKLLFLISLSGGYFSMSNVQYDSMKFFSNGIEAPTTFSYFCGDLTLSGVGSAADSSTFTLLLNSIQFQAPFGATADTAFVFGDPWHCVGFFTPGILMGLFLVILLLSITFIGICWMMDINTMDRFDDPKGKTITVNASE